MPKTIIVFPCYNEASRWDEAAFRRLLDVPSIHLVMVDDGSRDATGERIERLRTAYSDRLTLLRLPSNKGKGEAVRQGLLMALKMNSMNVGYADADFAAPPQELLRLAEVLEAQPDDIRGVMGSRIRYLGVTIERRAVRHYAGRLFSTLVSLLLQLPVYDTQCGAKFFRSGPFLREALREPFLGRWTFDVELIGRLSPARRRSAAPPGLIEVPLREWRDKPGSNVSWSDIPGILIELCRLRRRWS